GESRYRRNQYGFAAGGPFAKDKSFWFASFEQQRILDRPERHFSVPTVAQRSFFGVSPFGDCEKGLAGGDDLTKFFLGQGIVLFGCAGQATFNLIPNPNNPAGPYGANTFTKQLSGDGDGTILSFKLDQRLSERHIFTGRYNFTDDS